MRKKNMENWEYVRNLRAKQIEKWYKILRITFLKHKRFAFEADILSDEEFTKLVDNGGAYDTTGMKARSFMEYLIERYMIEKTLKDSKS